jgi:hypothetical protein
MLIQCPWCKLFVWIEDIGCGIFSHAVMKNTMKQIITSKEQCEYLKYNDLIFGCGCQFRLIGNEVVKSYV